MNRARNISIGISLTLHLAFLAGATFLVLPRVAQLGQAFEGGEGENALPSVTFLEESAEALSEPISTVQPWETVAMPTPEPPLPEPLELQAAAAEMLEEVITAQQVDSQTLMVVSAPTQQPSATPTEVKSSAAQRPRVAKAASAAPNATVGASNASASSGGSGSAGTDSSSFVLRNPKPRYPEAARRRKLEGVVLLAVEVNSRGVPISIKVQTSSGHLILDEAAVNGVRKWRFRPGGQKASTIPLPIRFSLTDA